MPSPRTVVTSRPATRCAGMMHECTGSPSTQHPAGAAVARVAALLHLDVAGLAQQRAQALAGERLRLHGLAVHREPHRSSSCRISSASSAETPSRQSAAPCASVNQVGIAAIAPASAVGGGQLREPDHLRPRRAARDAEHERAARRRGGRSAPCPPGRAGTARSGGTPGSPRVRTGPISMDRITSPGRRVVVRSASTTSLDAARGARRRPASRSRPPRPARRPARSAPPPRAPSRCCRRPSPCSRS